MFNEECRLFGELVGEGEKTHEEERSPHTNVSKHDVLPISHI